MAFARLRVKILDTYAIENFKGYKLKSNKQGRLSTLADIPVDINHISIIKIKPTIKVFKCFYKYSVRPCRMLLKYNSDNSYFLERIVRESGSPCEQQNKVMIRLYSK